MDSKPEFPVPGKKEMEAISYFFEVESEFIEKKDFFTVDGNIVLRKHAVAVIAQNSRALKYDAFVCYLAMNYFDRYLSKQKMSLKDVNGRTDTGKLRLIAISCLTLSSKIVERNIEIGSVLKDLYPIEDRSKITAMMLGLMEYTITRELTWKLNSVTAFCFLNKYNLYFKQFVSFKRCCINEIIVQAQGEDTFIHYLPSDIALSAFLAAAQIVHPSKYNEIEAHIDNNIGLQKPVKECVKMMVDMCKRMNILIETLESEICSGSCKAVSVTEEESKEARTSKIKEIQQSSGLVATLVDFYEEKKETPLIRRRRGTRNTETSHLQEEVEGKKYVSAKEIQAGKRILGKGKGINVTQTSEADKAKAEEIIRLAAEKGAETQAPPEMEVIKKLLFPKIELNLKWPIDAPPIKEGVAHTQTHESTTISLRIPGTQINLKFGCCSCNIS